MGEEQVKTLGSRKPLCAGCARTCIILTLFSLLTSFCVVHADYVMLPPPQEIVVTETNISESSTIPARIFFINVTNYDAKQIVKNITVDFREPVTHIDFAIEVLNDRPTYAGMPRNETVREYSNDTVLQYSLIRFLTAQSDKITNVTMIFAVEKAAAREKDEGVTLSLYRYDGREMQEIPIENYEEDDAFLYFNTTTIGSAYVAITRVLKPTTLWWWPVVVIITVTALMAIGVGIIIYRRLKSTNLSKTVNT
jgi:PGF-pre-PGF domain-containing protein